MEESLYQQLLQLGMKPEELGSWQSDLHVKKNKISDEWLKTYKWKQNVHMFRSQIDHTPWYDVPFGYMPEHMAQTIGRRSL